MNYMTLILNPFSDLLHASNSVPFLEILPFLFFRGCSSVFPFFLSPKDLGVKLCGTCGCSSGLGGGSHGCRRQLFLRESWAVFTPQVVLGGSTPCGVMRWLLLKQSQAVAAPQIVTGGGCLWAAALQVVEGGSCSQGGCSSRGLRLLFLIWSWGSCS